MTTTRLEAFSDGVLAIIITIMVLEMHVPEGSTWAAIRPVIDVFTSYALSFVFVGIYWSNHHHLMQASQRVSGAVLWANLHLLFWLSLIPFVTRWVGRTNFASLPVAAYGLVLFLAAVAYYVLVRSLLAHHRSDSRLARAIGTDFKGKISVAIYLVAIPLAFVAAPLAVALYVAVAVMWLVPDRRIEDGLSKEPS